VSDFLDRRVEGSQDLAVCPFRIDRVAMWHRWDQLAFLHWPYQPELVQRLLPSGLTVETFEGRAWVGLVPFVMEVRSSRGRVIPWPFRFPETNVRTYVTGPEGEPGVWFLSLDASRLGAVPFARSTYRVRYFWSKMSFDRKGDSITYAARRRWPGNAGAVSETTIDIGSPYSPDELTPFDHYLTARWSMYGTWGGTLLLARARHEPWPLRRAHATWRDEFISAAGLPDPTGEPVVHWSAGVDVEIGYPRQLAV
jgi:uncharacterized protein YqjF (DUF2071 family)